MVHARLAPREALLHVVREHRAVEFVLLAERRERLAAAKASAQVGPRFRPTHSISSCRCSSNSSICILRISDSFCSTAPFFGPGGIRPNASGEAPSPLQASAARTERLHALRRVARLRAHQFARAKPEFLAHGWVYRAEKSGRVPPLLPGFAAYSAHDRVMSGVQPAYQPQGPAGEVSGRGSFDPPSRALPDSGPKRAPAAVRPRFPLAALH